MEGLQAQARHLGFDPAGNWEAQKVLNREIIRFHSTITKLNL